MRLKKIRQAMVRYWDQDHIAFLFELFGSVFTIAASMVLAATAKSPDMLTVYLLYLVGSSVMCYAYIRRNMIWSVVLTIWFTIINITGLIVLLY